MTMKNLLALGLFAAALAGAGCDKPKDAPKVEGKTEKSAAKKDDHGHGEGPHGGTIVELGKHHGEFIVDHAKKLATIYILDEDVMKADPIAVATLLLSIKSPQFQVEMKADPQPGDPKGTSSRFVATHDNFAKEQEFEGTVSVVIDGKPFLGDFKEKEHKDGEKKTQGDVDAHGRAVVQSDPKEAEVYLKPGGIYTLADIEANGKTTVSVKYKNLKVSHDIKPKVGDKLCPVTLTKSNANLTWVIGAKKYEFCCPPCVEEFVTLAKTNPEEVKAPETYVKK